MTEWWTYGLSDFLMFSPEAYWRLLARYNARWWPAQLAAEAACAILLWIALRGGPARLAAALLALAWAFTGWAFHGQAYAEIFLAAPWLAIGCAAEAVLWVAVAFLPTATRPSTAAGALIALALLFPLLSFAQGRGWAEAEGFGWMPDPTALATLGWLLGSAMPLWRRIVLAIVPVLSLALGAATRWLLA
jgi:hypothetical protein